MSKPARRYLLGISLFIGLAAGIGWILGDWLVGLLFGCLGALLFNVRSLLTLERALREQDFSAFASGSGIWHRLSTSFVNQKDRADRYKTANHNLMREIRRSTNAMYDGAVVLDANNGIVMCNKAAKELAGFKRKKDRGRRVDHILRAPELSELLRDGDYSRAIEIRSPLRENTWLHCRIAPYGGGQKLLFIRNVSDRVRINKMRRDFVANASHELRSPLTVIRGYVDAMSHDPDLPDQWVRPATEMLTQTHRMGQVIKVLLELSRLENDEEASTDDAIDMAQLITRIAENYADENVYPTVIVDADPTVKLLGSAIEIESVVGNLIANAVRHTPVDGTVTVIWALDKGAATLTVSDTGEGIAKEHIPRLTERFFRVDRGRSRADGGTGLGLAIVKHALLRHGAELRITSKVNEGSKFACRFPQERISVLEDKRAAS